MRFLLAALIALAAAPLAAPLAAQDHSSHAAHTGHGAPAKEIQATTVVPRKDEPDQNGSGSEHAEHDHGATTAPVGTGIDHAEHEDAADTSAPPPRAFAGPRHAADGIYGSDAMKPARADLEQENGEFVTGTIMLERFEARLGEGEDLYLWDAQAWYGGDFDKLWLKSEGEGGFGGEIERAELQALWSRAITPWFDLQAGFRYDLEPGNRAHAVMGVQGLVPYMIEMDAAAFLSDRGDLTARVEAEYDQLLTQRLILQPRIEISLAAQDIPERRLGSGVTSLEAGLRLRYEVAREFAPYLGIDYETRVGRTANHTRAMGDDPDRLSLVLGLRAWF